ncbi:hypothetical protein JL11_07640 [Brevundimonas sp. DS20]|nr:hypothetical protein JL11_07640 [Brevundimonas sp. DS20]
MTVGSLVSSVGGALSQPKVSTAGNALGWVGDPNGPMHFAAGRIAVGGDLRHKKAYGPNDRMYFSAVTVVSDAGPITAFESFTANDVPVTFDGSGKANSSYYANVMWRRTQLGNQPEPSYLASPSGLEGGAALPNWGASHKLSGKAAFILTLSENSKQSAYKGQQPKPRHVIRGLKAYDWRLDSTYPGGSGPHRLDQPTTWTYTANPILWAVKWILGLWEGPDHGGAPQLDTQVGGMGVKVENIDLAAFTEAANIADAHGWTCAAWPSTDDDKAQVLDAFLQAGGAYYIQRGGKESCIHRAAPRVSVATISAADTAGPIELDTGASFTQRKNTGVPTYLSEADGWKMTALGQVSAPEWLEEDGGRERSVPVTYSYVDRAKQAAELMCLAVAHTREGIRGRIPLKPYMQGIQPGSAFTIIEPEFVLNGLKCLCLETNYDAMTGVHTVTFVSESDGKYAFAFGQAPNPPAPPALEAVDPTYVTPPQIGDWTIVPRPPAPGGGQLPGFDLGGIVSNETATAVEFAVWEVPSGVDPNDPPPAGADWQSLGTYAPTVTQIPFTGQPDRYYWVGVTYIRNQNSSERLLIGLWLNGKLISDDVDPNAPGLNQIKADIAAAFGDIFDVSELIGDTRADLEAADAALGSAIGSLDSRADTLETQTASLDANKASVSSLNAQITRIDNAEAVNASQALALVDLENGKVALSEYDTLRGEVTAARDGAPSLLGQIQNLKSVDLDLQGNKASVESVNALTARTANTEADIIDLELALATETGARAQAIQQVSASSRNRPNMLANGSGELGLRGISCIHIGGGGVVTPLALFAEDTSWGRIIRIGPFGGGTYILEWDNVTAVGSTSFTITGDAVVLGLAAQDRSYFDIQCLDGNGNLVPGGDGDQNPIYGSHDFSPDDANRNAYAVSFTTPAGTVRVRSRFIVEAQNSNPSYIAVRQVKTERGSLPASRYSADASQAVIEASVTEQSLAIIDLETQQALASYQLIAAATGGKPARFALVSSTAGSYVAIDAPYIFWGDNTVFDDATDTLQTTVGPNIRVLAFGAPFGASGNLLEWWGPSSIAIGSMTTANGLNGRMTTAPYVFDNVVVTVAARFAAGTVTVFRTTSSTTAAQLTSTGTVLVEASVTSTSEDDVTAPIVTADVVGVSSGGVETVLATKSVGSGLPEDPLVYTFAPVQGSYPTYRVKVRGSGPVSKNGQSTVEVTLKTSPVA